MVSETEAIKLINEVTHNTWGVCLTEVKFHPEISGVMGTVLITGEGVHFAINKLKGRLPPQLGILRALFHAVLKPTESNSETNKNPPKSKQTPREF